MILQVLAGVAKPILLTGAVASAAVGGWFAYSNFPGDDPTAFQRLQSQSRRLLISEFGANADTIVAVDPNDVAGSREVIATIDHAPEYGIFATLAPDGEAIAYTALPVDAPRPAPEAPAIAGVVAADGTTTILANDIDLLVPPVWSPDNASIVVRKNTACDASGLDCEEYPAGAFELVRLGLDGARSTITSWRSASAFPIAFAPDGATFYFATLNATGTDLHRVAPDGSGEALIAHLSDEVARDWRISPDGTSIAYAAAESGRAPAIVARIVDLASGAIADALATTAQDAGPPSTGIARGEFNPAWSPDGALTVAQLNIDGGSTTVSVADAATTEIAASSDQMNLPLEWSPDGAALAVRAVEGETPYEAGAGYVEVVTREGRERVSDSSDVTIVGWTR